MRSFAVVALVAVCGCSSAAPSSSPEVDAGADVELGGARDAAPDAVIELPDTARPSPLWVACASDADCTTGWTCYLQHTATSWGFYTGGDIYGHCTLTNGNCSGSTSVDCSTEDGTCSCPMLPNGTYPNCQPGDTNFDEKALVCVPTPRR